MYWPILPTKTVLRMWRPAHNNRPKNSFRLHTNVSKWMSFPPKQYSFTQTKVYTSIIGFLSELHQPCMAIFQMTMDGILQKIWFCTTNTEMNCVCILCLFLLITSLTHTNLQWTLYGNTGWEMAATQLAKALQDISSPMAALVHLRT